MKPFADIIGNEDIKRYFNQAIEDKQLSHSYIFEGPYGSGKNTFALELAKVVLCENPTDGCACDTCSSCHMIDAKTHPDVIVIDKDTKVTKIDTIRENIVREMDIKPYQSDYKFIIVRAADSISTQGQNAILKTIEEPPAYGIIILVCENIASLLPTIKSRCIQIRFNPITDIQMQSYLEHKGLSTTEQKIYTKLSQGSIGLVEDILADDTYMTLRRQSIDYLEELNKGGIIELYALVKEICDQKEVIEQILNFWLLWYRDIMIVKVSQRGDLYYHDYKQQLLDMSYKLTYNKVSQNLESIKRAILDIRQNIYSTFVIEHLLLQLKERKNDNRNRYKI